MQLLDRTRVLKLLRAKRESGSDPYKFMLLRIIYCRCLDELEVKRDGNFPTSAVLLERLISTRLGRENKHEDTVPVNMLFCSESPTSEFIVDISVVGILPVSLLSLSVRYCKLTKFPIDEGIDPLN
jgi:hypothetical protein